MGSEYRKIFLKMVFRVRDVLKYKHYPYSDGES